MLTVIRLTLDEFQLWATLFHPLLANLNWFTRNPCFQKPNSCPFFKGLLDFFFSLLFTLFSHFFSHNSLEVNVTLAVLQTIYKFLLNPFSTHSNPLNDPVFVSFIIQLNSPLLTSHDL